MIGVTEGIIGFQGLRLSNPMYLVQFIVFLFIVTLGIYWKKSRKVRHVITQEELQKKLDDFQPEPLVNFNETYAEPLVPKSIPNLWNLCRTDYLRLAEHEQVKRFAVEAVRKYGVGSCGPRGFYGTIDIHLDLETRLADFMQQEEAVLYSYSLSTMSSAIIAYCKKGDMLFCDEKLSESTMQAITAAKTWVTQFKHNDMQDLEEKLRKFDEEQATKKIKARKFLIVEGIYASTGKMCPLKKLMALREKFMLRMFLDETISFGSIGKHGRGVTEHFQADRLDIDLIIGSLEFGIPSIGGFCVGSNFIIEHQRLSGLGYCFSASLPPLHSSIAYHILEMFETQPELFEQLHTVARKVHNMLAEVPNVHVVSDELSPKKVFRLETTEKRVFIDKAIDQGILFDEIDESLLAFNINVNMNEDAIETLRKSFAQLVK